MPNGRREMFSSSSNGVGARKRYTIPLSIAAHVVGIVALVVIPLMGKVVMPMVQTSMSFMPAAPTPPPPPPPTPAIARPKPVVTDANPSLPPIDAPKGFTAESGIDNTPAEPGVPGGIDNSVIPGVIDKDFALPPSPPPPPAPTKPVRVGCQIRPPQKIKHVAPVYPPIAQSARVAGVVVIEATIDSTGKVQDARVLRSIPLLDQSALDAVRQWVFTPTLLGGEPVPIILVVTVNFALQ